MPSLFRCVRVCFYAQVDIVYQIVICLKIRSTSCIKKLMYKHKMMYFIWPQVHLWSINLEMNCRSLLVLRSLRIVCNKSGRFCHAESYQSRLMILFLYRYRPEGSETIRKCVRWEWLHMIFAYALDFHVFAHCFCLIRLPANTGIEKLMCLLELFRIKWPINTHDSMENV